MSDTLIAGEDRPGPAGRSVKVQLHRRVYDVAYWAIILLFVGCGISLIVLAAAELWASAAIAKSINERFGNVLQSIGLLTVAVASLELSQTILEEEVRRHMHVSAPTRVRRFMSRFLVVVVVALSIETLVLVFALGHQDPSMVPRAAAVGVAVGAILAGWGLFIHFNSGAETLEPEAMQQAKREDRRVDS